MAGYNGKSLADSNAEYLARQTLTVRCALCKWTVTASAPDALEEQRDHFLTHGRKRQKMHRRRTLGNFRSAALTDDEKTEIDAVLTKRRHVHGIAAVLPPE